MDGGAWWAVVHGVAKNQTRLSDFTFTLHFHALEKEMATTPVFLPGESQGRGAWWAAICGVAQSRTRLTRLSSSGARRVCVFSHVRLFYDPMDCSPPGCSVHGIFQARILERVAISFSRGPSWPRDQTPYVLYLLLWQADSLPLSHQGSSSFSPLCL